MTQSYTGHDPYLDEYSERLDNAEHLQVGGFGAKQVVLYDATGNPITLASIGSAMAGGTKTVSSSGTAVALGSASCKKVWIIALSTNTGIIYVGGSDVLAASKNGYPLQSGDSQSFDITNISGIYIDSTVSAEGVSFVYTS